MAVEKIKVPDIGTSDPAEIIELYVAIGDSVSKDDPLIALETNKATVEVPCPTSGVIKSLALLVGDKVVEGQLLAEIECSAEEGDVKVPQSPVIAETKSQTIEESIIAEEKQSSSVDLIVPDTGTDGAVAVIEITMAVGDTLEKEATMLVLESDKATMEIPAPSEGTLTSLAVQVGDQVKSGDLIGVMSATSSIAVTPPIAEKVKPLDEHVKAPIKPISPAESVLSSAEVYAGPAVRKQGRELGVDLGLVVGSGVKGRITKEDLQEFVKQKVQAGTSGPAIEPVPEVDFSRFGPTRVQELNKIKQLTAQGMLRSWLNVPHVTQFDEADITDLEAYRKSLNQSHLAQGIKVNVLAFIVKAVVKALQAYPTFNSSLASDGKSLVLKDYFNIGIAVETEQGLLVPVIKDVQGKSLLQIVHEITALADKARKGKLALADMQGGSFTISSLGAIGGTAFTPIVNAPEVAILGVSRSKIKPVYMQDAFQPRLMLPLSLSYDHRVIDGAEAARFTSMLAEMLQEIRHLML